MMDNTTNRNQEVLPKSQGQRIADVNILYFHGRISSGECMRRIFLIRSEYEKKIESIIKQYE